MKKNYLGMAALIVALAVAGLEFWKRPAKIGYAETSVILSEFSEAVQAKKQYQEAQKDWDKNLKILNDSLTATMDHMKTAYDKATPAEKERLRDLLRKRNDDLQRYTNAVKTMSIDKERELMDPVIKKVNSFLSLWGGEHGYDMILGTMSGGNILQASKGMNVTSEVLKGINEHYRNLPLEDAKKTAGSAGEKPSPQSVVAKQDIK